jgi:hypothetical protein
VPHAGKLQVVQLDDVTTTVFSFLQHKAPSGLALKLTGPDRLSFKECGDGISDMVRSTFSVYGEIGTCLVSRLWVEPLGAMLKIWPALILNVVALAISKTGNASLLDAQVSAHHRSGCPAGDWRRHSILYAAGSSDR